MVNKAQLKEALVHLDLFDKAREIHTELGDRAALSYLKSSYRLLSKVYHPDLNYKNIEKAKKTQQRLNRLSQLIGQMKDEEIVQVLRKEPVKTFPKKKKILVVEDEFGLQDMFRDIFVMEGYDVRVAVDGLQGYEVYREFKPNLIFTDVVMPEMSGLELVRKIRETDPQIKVIYVSGFFGIRRLKGELDEDISRHGYPTLSKPFRTSTMLNLVREYLDSENQEQPG